MNIDVHESDDRGRVRQIDLLARLTIVHHQRVVVGADRDDGCLADCPLRHGGHRLSRKFQLGRITHLFGRPRADRSHADEIRLDLLHHLDRLFVVLVEDGIGEDSGAFDADVLPTTDRKLPILMVQEQHGILAELFEIGARSEHTESVGIDRFVVQNKSECCHRNVLFSTKLNGNTALCKSHCNGLQCIEIIFHSSEFR